MSHMLKHHKLLPIVTQTRMTFDPVLKCLPLARASVGKIGFSIEMKC